MEHAWLQRELGTVAEELAQAVPTAPPEHVSEAIEEAAAELVPHATIVNYLPILVRRRALARLQARHPRPSGR